MEETPANLQDRIPSTLAQESVMGVLHHETGRQRIISIIKEHENTRDFETAVSDVVERYLKIKTSERIGWAIGIIAAGIIGYFISKI